jgi:hypothetical protein
MRAHITTTNRLSFIAGVLLGPAGACGNPTEAPPIAVQRLSVTPAAASAQVGDRITLTAILDAAGTVPSGEIIWRVVPAVPLLLSADRLSATWVAPRPGQYQATLTVGARQATSLVSVLTYPSGSPLTGQWRAVSWQFQPEDGAPESISVDGVYLDIDSLGPFGVMLPPPYVYDDPVAVLSYPTSRVEGQHLLLCQQYGSTVCDTATWTLDGPRLSIIGPRTKYTMLPDFEARRGVSTWEFVR